MGEVVSLANAKTGSKFSGGLVTDFAGGWALIPFIGEKPHYWENRDDIAREVGMDMSGDRQVWKSLCGVWGSTHAKVPPLGAGDFGMCKRCLAKAPHGLTKEDRRPLTETDPRVTELFR